ncbi:RluA family pseudouridine synthase [Rhodopila sp.]|jgi:23S rRNA pseudouridine955/2504/2580 synthase|uniref:RluA family pseudouridine synthase n=1 Tax=Rhodopila sp. TaxID=2480087 RepID=UPI002CA4C729|nr:RluA family pseudouridine synthase [Rhodopila sp.]HVZ10438.1 RluA family pseudouridine synthase [Rhodopila sp.]
MAQEPHIVTEDEAGIRLDRWVRRHFSGVPQSAIQKLCRTGKIRIDGQRADTATRLAPGQTVMVPPLAEQISAAQPVAEVSDEDARDLQRLVIYCDDQVLVLNKPYGLPVQGGPGIKRHLDGMLNALRFGSEHRPRLVHRLDRDTTGALLLARTPGVAARLAALFRGRDVDKTYWAIVAGRPVPPEGRIDLPLKRIGGVRGERTAPADRDDPDAARAITDYRTLDHAARKLAWLELKPLTGRTHQLRVHCVALRTPVLGDEKYEKPDQNNAFSAVIQGLSNDLHLHARRLELPHPAGGRLVVEADLAPHMRATFQTLGFHAPPAQPPRKSP